ncbi:metal ABC transporter ATP-binding protein [Ruminococcus gauvreauii]|uniref:Metal ABC transporter ATP-binding protein n=1 Tax=Ruminococcus gauvreauii TaxID=438033 RepID=A0ABY5VDH8_9FIRM|nr:metal ABC transporter ATP-binding protein [Ruminococcus gauvreauii]UWP58013.1 metal ABC transporter ATP-binding protein [Ruminococcus gauvreauii]
MNVIDIRDLSFAYGDEKVLREVSLQVAQGEYAVLLGENGTGKSTFLKLLLGELKPQQGTICLFGGDTRKVFHADKIGYVPQNSISLNPFFPATVEEIVLTNLYSQIGWFRLPGKKQRQQAATALRWAGMEEYRKSRIGELSGGQQQRVMLARALVGNPELLVLDEPTTGVDTASVKELYQTLERLNREEGVTILMVTHASVKECAGISRIYHMEEGQVVER